jgi:hypothetical protein
MLENFSHLSAMSPVRTSAVRHFRDQAAGCSNSLKICDRRSYREALMAQESYKGRLILSRPEHPALTLWRPYAKVMWQDENGFQFHEFVYTHIVFNTEKEAIAYGFAAARAWIEKEL